MTFKKSVSTILSAATILTAISPCAFAEGTNSEEKHPKSMSTTDKGLLGAAGAIGLAATAGIIYYAVKNSNAEATPLYVETLKGTSIYEKHMELHKGVFCNAYELVENSLNTNKELDINALYDEGYTLLHLAAQNGHLKICKLLIENGADVNAKDKFGLTPFQIATLNNKPEICELLINNGVNVNAKDYKNMTPLDYAKSDEIKQLLTSHDAKHSNKLE